MNESRMIFIIEYIYILQWKYCDYVKFCNTITQRLFKTQHPNKWGDTPKLKMEIFK
jgi:hypothetical protein